jgi:hypothetical protein
VYNAEESGLNDAMVVLRFALPTIHTHLWAVEEGTFMADLDVGEMFSNFSLHPTTQPWAGVDLTLFLPSADGRLQWMRWCRSLMRCKSSLYQACQAMLVADELIRGSPRDMKNPFRWDWVRMNLPGSANYCCSKPWVSKVRTCDMRMQLFFEFFRRC